MALLSPVTAGSSRPNFADATSARRTFARMRTARLPVEVLLDTRAYTGRHIRLYVAFPQPLLDRDLVPVEVLWKTTGRLWPGVSVDGGRTLIFQGDITQSEIQERFEFTLHAAEAILDRGLHIEPLFEADLDGVRSVVAANGPQGRPVALEVYPRAPELLGATADPRPGELPRALSIQPAGGGIRVEAALRGRRFAIAPEYSDLNGFTLNGGFASVLGRRFAFGLLATRGPTKKEWMLNAGWHLGRAHRIILTVGRLYQSFGIPFPSGTTEVPMHQNAGAFSYQLGLGRAVLQSLDVDGYFTRAPSRKLEPLTISHDDASQYELYLDPRRLAGGSIDGLQARAVLAPWPSGTVRVSLGAERLAYDYLAGSEVRTLVTEGLRLNQHVGLLDLSAAADSFASQRIYSLGVAPRVFGGRHQTSLTFTAIRGRHGLPNDNQLRLTYSLGFGGPQSPAGRPAPQRGDSEPVSPAFDLLPQVFTRPHFIPAQVVARLDPTASPQRLIAIEKTGLPDGSVVDRVTGDVMVPLTAAGIVEITRDGLPFTNSGQFSIGPEVLVVHTSEIAAPSAGSLSTYVLTIQETPGIMREVTVVVAPGSVHIVSVTIGEQIDTLPDDFAFEPRVDVPRAAVVVSNGVVASGINAPTPISISGGEYAIDGASYTSAAGTVSTGQAVTVRVTSSASFSTPVSATLTIGLVSATFTATTLAEDITPDVLDFAPRTGVTLSTIVISEGVAITGINTPTAISISGGEYVIDGRSDTSEPGTITNGQTVAVQLTSSPNFSTAVSATLTIGSASATFTVTTFPEDTTPDDFSFGPQMGVALHTPVTSNIVTISGINNATAVSISSSPGSAAQYSIGGGPFTAGNSTVSDGQTLQVRLTSSNDLATTATATSTVGGVSRTFSVTTADADTTPDAFSFTSQTDVLPSTLLASNTITVSGINSDAAISIAGGEYLVGAGNNWKSTAGTVSNGDAVKVRQTSSSTFSTTTTTMLTIGGVSGTFSVTTQAQDICPDPFSFVNETNVNTNRTITSNTIAVSGINSPAAISISGDGSSEYKIGPGNAWTSAAGTVNNGDDVTVRHTSSLNPSTMVTSTLTIGTGASCAVSASFSSTTKP